VAAQRRDRDPSWNLSAIIVGRRRDHHSSSKRVFDDDAIRAKDSEKLILIAQILFNMNIFMFLNTLSLATYYSLTIKV
jgi:hypothetical protein